MQCINVDRPDFTDAESGLASIEVILSPDDESQDRDDQEADNDEAQEGTQPTERDRGTRSMSILVRAYIPAQALMRVLYSRPYNSS